MSAEATGLQQELAKYSNVVEADKPLLEIWLKIKERINHVQHIKSGHERRHEAKILSADIIKSLSTIFDLVAKYPAIKLEFDTYNTQLTTISQYINENLEALEKCTEDYFRAYFKSKGITVTSIEFFNKKSGVQLGRVASIKYIDKISQAEQSLSYHIKTHQHGSASGSSSIKPVDPKELFIYKVLEYIGVGPEVHFIFNPLSHGGCYIATRDLGSSKPEKTQKNKDFKTYEALKGTLTKEDDLDKALAEELSCADLLSRIFRLEDVTTNATNFGFRINQDKKKCKIVDFRINTHDSYEYVDIFQGFLDGNGMFNYTDEYLKYVLKDRPEMDRILTADAVIKKFLAGGKKPPLMEAIKKASTEIREYILHKQGSASIDIPKGAEADFDKYIKSIHKNFEQLSTGILGKIKELSEISEQQMLQSAVGLQFQYQSVQQSSNLADKPNSGTKNAGLKSSK